jgi:peptide/nickel transport system permease protein
MKQPAFRPHRGRLGAAIAGAFGLVLLGCVAFCAVAAPIVSPYGPAVADPRQRLLPPAWEAAGNTLHLLGTDTLGRDVASRIIWGARMSLGVGLAATLLGGAVGSALGLCAGLLGGWTGRVVSWLIDVQSAFPFILLAIFILAVSGGGLVPVVGLLALATWVNFARVVRSRALTLRAQDYVRAAEAVGVASPRLFRRYVLPGVLPAIAVVASFSVAQAVLAQAALGFLGIGVDAATPSWGSMLDVGRAYLQTAWWMATFPGIAIALTVLGANLLGEFLGRHLDPLGP